MPRARWQSAPSRLANDGNVTPRPPVPRRSGHHRRSSNRDQNRWLRASNPIVVAHRGHSAEVPENTVAAYRRAIELGAEMIECDVNMTHDGELVMIHDWRLDRTTDGSGRVRDATLDEIRRLDAGSWFGDEFRGLTVPTTEETLHLAAEAGIMMCFEVKGEDTAEADRIADALVDLLVAHDALGWALMSSYHHGAMARAIARVPELILAPERLPDDVPAEPGDTLEQATRLGAPIIQNHWQFLTPELVGHLHANDIAIFAWPTTTDAEIAASLEVGVDGVMGDDVGAMVRAVAALPAASA
jgi:glycerophosphoryl diester phosphodiesterase